MKKIQVKGRLTIFPANGGQIFEVKKQSHKETSNNNEKTKQKQQQLQQH